jgi:pimeloyl-ACP methyl ester carboxylesterase
MESPLRAGAACIEPPRIVLHGQWLVPLGIGHLQSYATARLQGTRALLVFLLAMMLLTGCSSQRFLIRRDTPANPLAATLQLASSKGPSISQRTQSVLRRFALADVYADDPQLCLEVMQELLETEVESGLVYAISEIAYILGAKADRSGERAQALDMYSVALTNAYMFLFHEAFDTRRNPYDPLFRGACDLYNESLEASLRIVNAKGQLRPGQSYELTTGTQTYEIHTVVRGQWNAEDFERFEFVSDYEVEGLPSSGLSYGLGVPLIAVRREGNPDDPREKYYPEGLSFPVTALARVVKPGTMPGKRAEHRHHCVLELHDPLVSNDLRIGDRLVPLETDLSTSLAFFLDSPQFRETSQATLGLLNPQKTQEHRGIYMLEPFDPQKIPVLMVHGLWSSPVTWMPMFNDLRSFQELRENYQFWFYQYPTGQPFWLSATQMRADLSELRQRLDPNRLYEALDYTVLVGHSMGGLVSRMQTIESSDDFWKILSDKPFQEVQGKDEHVDRLREAAFFTPNRDVRRVVTIGTPHRGSDFANDTTRWLGRKLIKLPQMMVASGQQLISQNPGVFRNTELLTTSTSIDSLSPDSPVFPAMWRAPTAPWVKYHNIIGLVPTKTWLGEKEPEGDGVVSQESAEVPGVESEIAVESIHQKIHRHPKAIFEVRRILLQHLNELRDEHTATFANMAGRPNPGTRIPARVVSSTTPGPRSSLPTRKQLPPKQYPQPMLRRASVSSAPQGPKAFAPASQGFAPASQRSLSVPTAKHTTPSAATKTTP